MSLTGTDKSAILLMTLGEDRAAEVFKHLSSREVQLLSGTMAGMSQVSHKQLGEILTEFEDDAEQYAALSVNASDYLRSVLVKALGEERAASLLEDILESRETTTGMETLNFMEPQSAADLIRDEPSPLSWCTSNAARRRISWPCSTNACATTSCCVSPPSAACSRRRWRS
ncbi:Flagellar motor switch protein FliG [Serratia marcescens]|nr:Flagellar motor switch protein FliG [Serratia marcescens]